MNEFTRELIAAPGVYSSWAFLDSLFDSLRLDADVSLCGGGAVLQQPRCWQLPIF